MDPHVNATGVEGEPDAVGSGKATCQREQLGHTLMNRRIRTQPEKEAPTVFHGHSVWISPTIAIR